MVNSESNDTFPAFYALGLESRSIGSEARRLSC